MALTTDQYYGLYELIRWYNKARHQFIEVSGIVGTGTWELIQLFIDTVGLDPREVMYLSYDQKEVLELATKRFHAYYLPGIIYKYEREVDFDSLTVINPRADGELRYQWTKYPRKKLDPQYRIIVIFDSMMLDDATISDIAQYGLPVILVKDPMLLPVHRDVTSIHEANIRLMEIDQDYVDSPIVMFAHKAIRNEPFKLGVYDNVSVVPRKQMTIYNLKSADMVITMSPEARAYVNDIYRKKVLKRPNTVNVVGERLILTEGMYWHKHKNSGESRVKVYMGKGTIGRISKINKHMEISKYVPFDFTPEFYDEAFTELVLDRHYLNNIDSKSRAMIPDEYCKMEYAYALTAPLSRISHWDKVTLVVDSIDEDPDIQSRMLYTAITRARQNLTILI